MLRAILDARRRTGRTMAGRHERGRRQARCGGGRRSSHREEDHVCDPQTKEVQTLVYTDRYQLCKGPNDLDFDAEGNLFFTDPRASGPGPHMSDRSGAIYQYSRDGV
jgi:sugar lactone lactonase YvrE